jgi:hypothetical protein
MGIFLKINLRKNIIQEKEIQKLTESNLQELFELHFVKSEFELHGLN